MRLKLFIFGMAFLAISILAYMIIKSPKHTIYDESFFIQNVKLLNKTGLNSTFITELKNQSPGPLYQIVHYAFLPITKYSIIRMRLVNFFFFLLTILFTYLTLKNKSNSPLIACMYISMPMTWVISGMALTEIPSMLFLVIFIYILQIVLYSENLKKIKQYSLIILSGLSLSLSIIGRSSFLMILLACPILFLLKKHQILIGFLILIASIFPIYTFILWKGLVPPDVQEIQKGVNLLYLFLSFGYMGILTLIIAYEWYFIPKIYYIYTSILTIVFIIINLKLQLIAYEPMKSLSIRIIPASVINIYVYIVPGIIMGVGLMYLSSCAFHIRKNMSNIFFLFTLLSGLLIIATTLKSSAQFSSRYVVQAAPLFLIAYSNYIKFNYKTYILQLIGIILGVFALLSYYQYSY